MRLIDLDPKFLKYIDGRTIRFQDVTLAEAQGLQCLCPKCFVANNGPIGTHAVEISFRDRGVPDGWGSHNKEGKDVRWQVVGGSGFADLQLAPSILLEGGCAWHGFIGQSIPGEVTSC